MEKRRPILNLKEVTSVLGYEVDPIPRCHTPTRLYSNLARVPAGLCEKTRRVYEASEERRLTGMPQQWHAVYNPEINFFELVCFP